MNATAIATRERPWNWLAAFVVADTVTQIAFKYAATSVAATSLRDFLPAAAASPMVWLAVGCYAGTFFVWLALLRRMELSAAFPVNGLAYLTVPPLAWLLFDEQLATPRLLGIVLVFAGTLILGTEPLASTDRPAPTSSTGVH